MVSSSVFRGVKKITPLNITPTSDISNTLVETNNILSEIQNQLALDFAHRISREEDTLKKIRSQNKKPAPIGVKEAAEDRLRDQRMERGGVDGNKRYDRPPARKATNKELGIRDFTSAEKEKRAKEIASHFKKMRR